MMAILCDQVVAPDISDVEKSEMSLGGHKNESMMPSGVQNLNVSGPNVTAMAVAALAANAS